MSTRIVGGPEVIALVEDFQDAASRLNVTVAALRHLLDLHDTRALEIGPVMQTLRNLLQEITQDSR